jgi:hypothetical protein
MEPKTGALDLPYTEFGEVVQALASCLIDRGYTRDQIVSRIRDTANFIESEWWDARGGDIVDGFADFLDLTAFPEEDD